MPMSNSRYGGASYAMAAGAPEIDTAIQRGGSVGITTSGTVQVTGVILLALLVGIYLIAKAMGMGGIT